MDEKRENFEEVLSEDEDYSLWVLLHQTTDTVSRDREKELNQYGIPIRQVATLSIINAIGGRATPTEIARLLFRRPHTVSSILKRMEKDGLVTKTHDSERRNVVRVALTEKGRQAYHDSIKRDSIHNVMSCLTAEERQQLRSCLEKLQRKVLG